MVEPKYSKIKSYSYAEALEKGLLKEGPPPTKEEALKIEQSLIEPKLNVYGLRFPKKHGKTEADYMRLSYKEEDEAFKREN